jgi:hypothetical protein
VLKDSNAFDETFDKLGEKIEEIAEELNLK